MFPCLGSEGGTQGLGLTVQEVYTELHQQYLLNTSFTTTKHPKTCLLFVGGRGGWRLDLGSQLTDSDAMKS